MADPAEEWRDVAEAPGYRVSNLGNVLGKRGTLLTQNVNQFGYKTVSPFMNGKTLYRQVHRLVAIAFAPNPDSLPLVNHIDGDRLNNNVSNLEWVTAKQNAERTVNHATESSRRSRKVIQTFPDGRTETWSSMKEAAEEAGVSQGVMTTLCRSGRPNASGSSWKYFEDATPAPPGEQWGTASGIVVSTHGRIRLPDGQIVVGRQRGAYLRYQSHGVHRLVAEVFCEKPPGANTVNHRDGNPVNNHRDNLEWVTQRENCNHAVVSGLSRRYAVRRTQPNGTVTTYPSIQEASRQTHISAGDIVGACKGRKKLAGGSSWEYMTPETAAALEAKRVSEAVTTSEAEISAALGPAPSQPAATPMAEPKIDGDDLEELFAQLGL